MSTERINIEAILDKHTSINPEENWERNGKFSITNYKEAIKEIVEQVVDKCAESKSLATSYTSDGLDYLEKKLTKESILNVKQLIDYETR